MAKFSDEIGKAIVARIPVELGKSSKSPGINNSTLAKSFSYSVVNTPKGIKIEINSSVDYADYADKGRKPGKPAPFVPIYEWVEKYKIGPARVRERTARQISYLIGRNGTKPLNYLEPSINFIWNTRKDLFVGVGKEIVQTTINQIIK